MSNGKVAHSVSGIVVSSKTAQRWVNIINLYAYPATDETTMASPIFRLLGDKAKLRLNNEKHV